MVPPANSHEKRSYDPFVRGSFPVGVRTIEALDGARNRRFPCEIWFPAAAAHAGQDLTPATQDEFTPAATSGPRRQAAVRNAAARPGRYPLLLYAHASLQHRRNATFLTTHLASHGYVVGALDHSEVVAPALARKDGESDAERDQRWQAIIGSRVPDVCFLLDHLLKNAVVDRALECDAEQVGIVGHSFGGWTALAVNDVEKRIRAVVALAPAGSSQRRPGILPVTLAFGWGRDVPTLYLVAENDTSLPLAGMYEIYERTPATKQMVILRRADHMHFVDNVEELHELVRNMPLSGALAEIQREMRPMSELSSGAQAQLFIRGLTLAHMDAYLRQRPEARHFLAGDLEAELGKRSVDVRIHPIGP